MVKSYIKGIGGREQGPTAIGSSLVFYTLFFFCAGGLRLKGSPYLPWGSCISFAKVAIDFDDRVIRYKEKEGSGRKGKGYTHETRGGATGSPGSFLCSQEAF